jgi:hypothetical protein
MKCEAVALSIEIKKSNNKNEKFHFNEVMLQAVLSGLSIAYQEVFIWQAGNHLAVWVVGDSADLLIHSFTHHKIHYKKVELLEGARANELLMQIAEGTAWNDCSIIDKLESFTRAYQLSSELNCLGSILFPLMTEGDSLLRTNAFILGSLNSWSHGNKIGTGRDTALADKIQIDSKSLFYRFSFN